MRCEVCELEHKVEVNCEVALLKEIIKLQWKIHNQVNPQNRSQW